MTHRTRNQSALTIILAESEIEHIPPAIKNHPQIKSYEKKRNKSSTELLLDASYHYAAMKKLPDWRRRGRPDIAHRCALHLMDSWANKQGILQFFIHTRDNYVIWINPKTRLPRQYHRFVGLIEQLMIKKRIIASNKELLTYEKKTLEQLLSNQFGKIFLFWEKGTSSSLFDIINTNKSDHLTFVIGGFPHGDFYEAVNLIEQKIAIEKGSYTASYLVAKSIITYELIIQQFK